MKIDKIRSSGKLLLVAAALAVFISGCRCAPKPVPDDKDPRVASEEKPYNIFTDNILSTKILSVFCTTRY